MDCGYHDQFLDFKWNASNVSSQSEVFSAGFYSLVDKCSQESVTSLLIYSYFSVSRYLCIFGHMLI